MEIIWNTPFCNQIKMTVLSGMEIVFPFFKLEIGLTFYTVWLLLNNILSSLFFFFRSRLVNWLIWSPSCQTELSIIVSFFTLRIYYGPSTKMLFSSRFFRDCFFNMAAAHFGTIRLVNIKWDAFNVSNILIDNIWIYFIWKTAFSFHFSFNFVQKTVKITKFPTEKVPKFEILFESVEKRIIIIRIQWI